MNFVLDENSSIAAYHVLVRHGYSVERVATSPNRGQADPQIWKYVCGQQAWLVTPDQLFRNSKLFPPALCGGIVLIHPGNLHSNEEAALLEVLVTQHDLLEYGHKLITLSPSGIQIH